MTRVKTEYSKPDIVKSSGKSDIFHQSPIAESEKKSYLDRNASTIFSSEPIPTQRPARKRSGFESNSDIFYDAKPVNHFEAAPSAEVYYPSGHDTTNDYEKVESSRLESLANFEEQFNFEKRRQMPPQQSHSDIFSHNVESAPSRGRRHYNSSGSATDIFNVLKLVCKLFVIIIMLLLSIGSYGNIVWSFLSNIVYNGLIKSLSLKHKIVLDTCNGKRHIEYSS